MPPNRQHPDFWYPIAALLSALRKLLRATAPDGFAAIALDARAHLAAITALIRRYLYVLAAEMILPPLRRIDPLTEEAASRSSAGSSRYSFPLLEQPSPRSSASQGEDPPDLQLALLLEAADRLVAVLANPAPHARRLARFLQRACEPILRELALPWHVIRRIGPGIDTLLMKLDRAARPEAWRGIEIDSS